MKICIGIDVGSVSTNIALINEENQVLDTLYIRTSGRPIQAVKEGLREIQRRNKNVTVTAVGTTGSGRQLAAVVVGADSVKNEITAHAVAAIQSEPDVQTIIEIGGQDSKIILIRHGAVVDFAMNSLCAAGTGSFLDQQAARLNIPIDDFGGYALQSTSPVRIAGRCAVFAESDMIHKQQAGHQLPDILNGLCHALVRNYLATVGKGKTILPTILFQGGVAANQGMKQALEAALKQPVTIPLHYNVMGAIGAALLASEQVKSKTHSLFRGFRLLNDQYLPRTFECKNCPNQCEIVEVQINGEVSARWGDRCGKWSG